MHADVMGKRILLQKTDNAVLLGSAILAAAGTGLCDENENKNKYKNDGRDEGTNTVKKSDGKELAAVARAVQSMTSTARVVNPRTETKQRYDEVYSVYKAARTRTGSAKGKGNSNSITSISHALSADFKGFEDFEDFKEGQEQEQGEVKDASGSDAAFDAALDSASDAVEDSASDAVEGEVEKEGGRYSANSNGSKGSKGSKGVKKRGAGLLTFHQPFNLPVKIKRLSTEYTESTESTQSTKSTKSTKETNGISNNNNNNNNAAPEQRQLMAQTAYVVPSLLASDFGHLAQEAQLCADAGAGTFELDMAISLYLYIVVIPVSVEWCIRKSLFAYLLLSHPTIALAPHTTMILTFTLKPPFTLSPYHPICMQHGYT